jgi:DNA processing protein
MEKNLHFQLALTFIPNIGDVLAKNLVSYCGGPEKVFKAKKKDLIRVPGIDEVRAKSILDFDNWKDVEQEISFIAKNKIHSYFYLDEKYPARLKGLIDAPVMLYAKGNLELNAARTIAIVGTRHATDYGKQITDELIEGLHQFDATIISGLAYGIDIAAHRAALKHDLQNIAVLGHGLNRLYPGQHRSVAIKMLEHGGLVTEFKSMDAFEPQNFPKRNRIVAGLSDAVIVIESAANGGALITAEVANNYNRDVFCIPGRVGDKFSEGCNRFIRTNKANLIHNAEDVANCYAMGAKRKNFFQTKRIVCRAGRNGKENCRTTTKSKWITH